MSIVIFCIDQDGFPRKLELDNAHFVVALRTMEDMRGAGLRHVCMSSEPDGMIGKPGVAAVEDGKTPDGEDYEWSKAGRAGRMKRADHEKIPADGKKL